MEHSSEGVKLNPLTAEVLRRAGWFPGRRFDPADYVRAATEAGYTVFPCAADFLSEFGGLHISFQNPRSPAHHLFADFADLDAIDRAPRGEFLVEYEALVGEALCPVGTGYSDYATLLMTPTGKVYGEYGEIWFVGQGGLQAIDAMCRGQEGLPR